MFSGLLSKPRCSESAAAERIWQTRFERGLVLFEVIQKQTHISQCFILQVKNSYSPVSSPSRAAPVVHLTPSGAAAPSTRMDSIKRVP